MDAIVGEIVRRKLDAGILPNEVPSLVWSGYGTGHSCIVCEQPILQDHTEYEAQYDDRPVIRFHIGCHGVWREEVQRRGS